MALPLPDRLRRWAAAWAGSLGAKLVLILSGVGLAGALAITVMLAVVITPSFNQLEAEAVTGHVERTRAVLGDFAGGVASATRDYGDWNASYDYMARPDPAFERESFSTLAMANLSVNGMAYVRPEGSIQIARWIDLDRQTEMPGMREALIAKIATLDIAKALGRESSASFFVPLGNTLAAVGIAQVRRSDGTGDPRGYVLMARTLTSKQLSSLLQVDAALDLGRAGADVAIARHPRRLDIGVPVLGPDGRAVATARYQVERDLSLLGQRMLLLAVGGSTAMLLVVMIALRRFIAKLVLKPLKRVERHMGVVRGSGQLAPLTLEQRGDEIGSLVGSFNAMLSQLKDLREQLEVQSFKLGRSESAVAVMHNVRNALNPISTILSQGLAQTPKVDPAMMERALAELAKPDVPDDRRAKLAAFVDGATRAEAAEREERRRQLELGRTALHNVLEIIGKQQADAHERPELSACDLTEIIAQNATIARYSGKASIAFSFPAQSHWVLASRVLLSQVVGNLFANAAEAIAATGRGGGSITVSIVEREGRIVCEIRDDGEGFDPATAPTLFQRGFSTRAHKSGGLGLHWCANTMLAMGGKLELRSDGAGLGAVAALTLSEAIVPAAAVSSEAA